VRARAPRVEHWDWRTIHPQLRVTLSTGLSSSRSFEEPQGLLDAADHWLHEAKRHGRNQIQPLMKSGTDPVFS
jgi:PleD family two-component response regulator